MATLTSLDQFVAIVERSRLIEPSRLRQYVDEQLASSNPPSDASKIARKMIADGLLTRFQASQLIAGRSQGFFLLDKFKVLTLLGAGGSGRVYLCEQLRLERLVAVKVLPIMRSDDANSVDRFYREARAAASLNHPNIVRVHDVDRTSKFHIMVLEYVDGASLQELVGRRGPLNPIRAANYISQASAGLHHAHECGWIHRDVKPANILLARSGLVQLLDLGLARMLRDKDMLTQMTDSKSVMGTVDYMSPEQAMSSHDVDIRTDVYSMGATLRFLLVGEAPFPEGSLANKLLWRQIRDPDPIRSLRPDVPQALCDVVDKMMARDPADRYQTPWEIVEALRPWTSEPIAPPTNDEMPDRRLFAAGGGSPSVGYSVSGRPSPGPLSGLDTPTAGPISTLSLLSQMLGSSSGPGAEATNAHGLERLATATAMSLPKTAPHPEASDTTANVGASASTTAIDSPAAGVSSSVAAASEATASEAAAPATVAAIAEPDSLTGWRRWANPWLDKRRIGVVCAALGGTVLVAAVVALWLPESPSRAYNPRSTNPSTRANDPAAPAAVVWETTPPAGRKPLLVVPEGDAPERLRDAKVFRTLQQAVDRAEAGDVIRICPQPTPGRSELVFQESITLKNLPANVVIEAVQLGTTAPRIDWLPPIGGDPQLALLTIIDSPGLRVRGFRFDGKRKLRSLVAVSGNCPEMWLEDLDFIGFQDRGLVFAGAMGDPPIFGARLSFQGSNFAKPAAAVSLEAAVAAPVEPGAASGPTNADGEPNPDGDAPVVTVNDGIALRDCRFEGLLVCAVRVSGPTQRLDVAGSRFFKCDYAFDLTAVPAAPTPELRIASNTFYQASAIIDVGDLLGRGLSGGRGHIALENNLFIRCDELVKASVLPTSDAAKKLFISLAGNFKEGSSLSRGVFFSEISSTDVAAIPLNRDDLSTFLRTPKTHRLFRSGQGDAPVGAP